MHLAAMGGHTAAVDVLHRAGHSLKVRSDEDATPLHLAAQEGRLFTVHRLCKLRVAIDDNDMSGCTSLTIAAQQGNNNIAQVLLDHGADVNHLTKTGMTGLSVACANGRLDIARTLLERGALVRSQDILAASEAGYANVIKIMLPHIAVVTYSEAKGIRIRRGSGVRGSIQVPSLTLTPSLHACAKHSHAAAATVLLDAGAEVNSIYQRFTPLHQAIKHDADMAVLDVLLSHGANPMAVTQSSSATSPILLASERGRLDVVKSLLLKTSKCMSQSDASGTSALIHAATQNDAVLCRYLLQCSIGTFTKLPSLSNSAGETALHIAARAGHLDCIREIFKDSRAAGIVNVQNLNKFTAVHLACREGHSDIVHFLLSHQAKVNTADNKGASPLQSSCESGDPDLVKMLLSSNASLTTAKLSGATPFHAVARRGYTDILQQLLERVIKQKYSKKKATNEALNKTMRRCGSTALMLAVKQGHLETVEMLARCQLVEINRKNSDNNSALMIATKMGDLAMCRVLVINGADIRAQCASGSPIAWSERQRDVEMSTVLLWKPKPSESEGEGERSGSNEKYNNGKNNDHSGRSRSNSNSGGSGCTMS